MGSGFVTLITPSIFTSALLVDKRLNLVEIDVQKSYGVHRQILASCFKRCLARTSPQENLAPARISLYSVSSPSRLILVQRVLSLPTNKGDVREIDS